jgi:3-hydroxyacyl-CoA dehydrogenase
VLTGGAADPAQPVPESAVAELELEVVGGLLRRPQTVDRITHMLATGKPLRN